MCVLDDVEFAHAQPADYGNAHHTQSAVEAKRGQTSQRLSQQGSNTGNTAAAHAKREVRRALLLLPPRFNSNWLHFRKSPESGSHLWRIISEVIIENTGTFLTIGFDQQQRQHDTVHDVLTC